MPPRPPHLPSLPPEHTPPTRQAHRAEVVALRRFTGMVDHLAARLLPYNAAMPDAPDQRARPTILIGLMLMLLLFGVIGSWASLMPLAAGAIAPGRVIAESNRKDIQHLEGGIVQEILVKDGDVVKAGQPLVRLDSTNAQAKAEQVLGQYLAAKATEARLLAERDGKSDIAFPPEYQKQEATNQKVKEALDAQRHLFATRREALEGEIGVLNQKIAQSGEEIRGLREQIAAASTQISLLNQEIATVSELVQSGNAVKSRLLALQRQQADLMGQRGNSQAMVSRANQTINESKISIINAKNDFSNKVATELKDTQVQLATLEEQSRAASDVARRVEVKAPIDGTVTALAIHTIGGVVQPGETLLSIVPANDRLVVEAHVSPQDIDAVHAGLEAEVKLTAYKTRYLRPVKGKVLTVSADRVDDKASQDSYFLARVDVAPEELHALGPDIKLSSGMPADVLIVTGKRTMLSYVMQPIRDSFGHAFHDQ